MQVGFEAGGSSRLGRLLQAWGVCCSPRVQFDDAGGSRGASHRKSRCAICRGPDAEQKRELAGVTGLLGLLLGLAWLARQ